MGYSRKDVRSILARISSTGNFQQLSSEEVETDGTEDANLKRRTSTISASFVPGLFLGWTLYCAMRRAYPQQMPVIARELDIPLSQLGLPNSAFALTYALAKFGGAIASDYVPCKECHVFGILLCGFGCAILGLCSNISSFVCLWGLCGIFHGFGWPTLANIMVNELPEEAKSKYWGVLSTAANVGNMLGPYGMELAAAAGLSWRGVFFSSGAFTMAMAFPVWLCLCASKSHGKLVKDCKVGKAAGTEQAPSTGSKLSFVLTNPTLLALIVSNGLCYFVRNSVAEWGLIYLQSTRLVGSQMQATSLLFWMEVGGSFGAFFSGYMSSLLGLRHGLTTLLGAALLSAAMGAVMFCAYQALGAAGLQSLPVSFTMLSVLHAAAGVGLNVVRTMIGLNASTVGAAAGAVGLANGLAEIVGQVGCMAASRLGSFATADPTFGWVSAMGSIALASAVIVGLHMPLIPLEERRLAREKLAAKKAE